MTARNLPGRKMEALSERGVKIDCYGRRHVHWVWCEKHVKFEANTNKIAARICLAVECTLGWFLF